MPLITAESTADILFSVGAHGDRAVIKGIEEQNYNSLGALSFWTVNPTSGMAERVRIDSNGNVGIGTTSPGAKLEVAGEIRSNNSIASGSGLRIQTAASTIGIVGASGWVKGTSATDLGIFAETGKSITFMSGGSATDRMTIDSSGNVGIGTTGPGSKLEVNGDITTTAKDQLIVARYSAGSNDYAASLIWSNSAGGSVLTLGNNANNEIRAGQTATNGYLRFITNNTALPNAVHNGTEVMRLTASGNVGIGTTSPGTKLDIESGASGDTLEVRGSTTNSSYYALTVNDSTPANIMLVRNDGVVYMKGNVGIGTTGPVEKLQVAGAVKVTGAIAIDTASAGAMGFQSSAYRFISWGSTGVKGAYSFEQYTPAGAGQVAMVIQADTGNVGIGYTDTSGNKLAVNGAIYSSSSITAGTQLCIGASCQSSWPGSQWAASGNNIYNTNSGNVGIGTTSPNRGILDIRASGQSILALRGQGDGETGNHIEFYMTAGQGAGLREGIMFTNTYGTNGFGFMHQGNAPMWFGTSNIERMRITNGGNVGIGYTDTSGNKLAVNGTIYSLTSITAGTQLCIGTSCQSSWPCSQWTTSGNDIYNTNSGNVGIGTTSPVSLTEISGSSPYLTLSNSATDVPIDTALGILNFYSYYTSTQSRGGVGSIRVMSETAFNTGQPPTYMSFYTHPNSGGEAQPGTVLGTATEKMRITAGGDVGIGTTADSGTDYSNNRLFMTGETHMASQGAHVWFGDSTIGNPIGIGEGLVNTLGYDQDFMSAYYRNSMRFFSNGAIERMRIDVNGNVGIGTTSPSALLTIGSANKLYSQGGSGTHSTGWRMESGGGRNWAILSTGSTYPIGAGKLVFWDETAASNRMVIDTNGNVGIGTTSPSDKLYIIGNDNQITVDTASEGAAGIFLRQAGVRQWELYDYQDKFHLYNYGTASDAITVLQSNGNVGIGTTSPERKLDVEGGIRVGSGNSIKFDRTNNDYNWLAYNDAANNFRIDNYDDAGSLYRQVLFMTDPGNVGIGTTSPAVKLQVAGAVRNSAPAAGYLELSGLLPGYSDNQYPTLKTDGTWIYLSTAGI